MSEASTACQWCGRSIYTDGARWLATKGKERGYDPLLCDAVDDGVHEPDTIEVTKMDGVTVGPDAFLVLRSNQPLTSQYLERLRSAIPADLKPRVLVIDSSFELVTVEAAEVGVLPCGCVPPCEGGHDRVDAS